jgi:hypothetical protein
MLYSCPVLLFHSEDGGDIFFWNIHWLIRLHCNISQETDSDMHTYSSKGCLALLLKDHVYWLQAWKGKLALSCHLMFSLSVLLESERLRIPPERNRAMCKLLPASCWFLVLAYPSSLKMKEICSSKVSHLSQHMMLYSRGRILLSHHCEHLTYSILYLHPQWILTGFFSSFTRNLLHITAPPLY